MRSNSKLRTIDLFAGAGGLSEGIALAGGTSIAAVEVDEAAVATLLANHPHLRVAGGDIRADDTQKALRSLKGEIDIVVGGPPCQPFSVAGHQRASEDPRDCVPDFAKAVRLLQPHAFVMENVSGLFLRRHRAYLLSLLTGLAALQYRVAAMVLDAADYGVPQRRRRLFVVGVRGRHPLRFPMPTHGPGSGHRFVSAQSAIDAAADDMPNNAIVTYARNPIMRPRPWDGMLVNGGGRPINLPEPSQTIPASAGGNRTHIVDRDGVLVRYHRHLLEGGLPRSGIVNGVRRLTVAESAMIQSFPQSYRFLGNQSARYRHVGNAVPPLLAAAVAQSVFSQLNGESRKLNLRPTAEAVSI